mgnify:CR=1 FL=1
MDSDRRKSALHALNPFIVLFLNIKKLRALSNIKSWDWFGEIILQVFMVYIFEPPIVTGTGIKKLRDIKVWIQVCRKYSFMFFMVYFLNIKVLRSIKRWIQLGENQPFMALTP